MAKGFFIAALLSLLSLALAHTTLTHIVINDVMETKCLRPLIPWDSGSNIYDSYPIQDSTTFPYGSESANYTCGYLPWAANPASEKCSVAAGSTVGVRWYHGAGYGDEDPELDKWIARSHRGPFLAYMAKSETGQGNVWFKVHQEGKIANSTDGQWTSVKWASPDTMLANEGITYFTIPADISPGNYLVRAEIIALHDNSLGGAQPYVRCAEVTVTGTGTANPVGVAIPGAYDRNVPGFRYSVYDDFRNDYPFPGPEVYKAGDPQTTGPPAPFGDCPLGVCPEHASCIDGSCYCDDGFSVNEEGVGCEGSAEMSPASGLQVLAALSFIALLVVM